MHIQIAGAVYSADLVPILLYLSDEDRANIAAMSPHAKVLAIYPDSYDPDAIERQIQQFKAIVEQSSK